MFDSRSLEIHAFNVGDTPDANQDFIRDNGGFAVVADEIDELLFSLHPHPDGLGVEMYFDAIPRQSVGKNLRSVPFLIAQEHRIVLDDRDLRPQSTKGLR